MRRTGTLPSTTWMHKHQGRRQGRPELRTEYEWSSGQLQSKPSTRSRLKSKTSRTERSSVRYALVGVGIAVSLLLGVLLIRHLRSPRPPKLPEPRPPVEIPEAELPPSPAEPSVTPREVLEDSFLAVPLTRRSQPPRHGETVQSTLKALGGTKAVFHGRSPGKLGHTPLFDQNATEVSACVNAGNPMLWVGGGGVNGEIASLLLAAARRHGVTMSPSRLSSVTADLHHDALRRALQNRGTLVSVKASSDPAISPFRTVYAYLPVTGPTWSAAATGENVSCVFIDQLNPEYTPHGNPRNSYVVYTVSPHGQAPDQDFNPAYQQTYNNIISAVQQFNESTAEQRQIARLRIPLLSSGIFAAGRAPEQLGQQAMRSLRSALRQRSLRTVLDFSWDTQHSFYNAARDLEQASG